MKRKRKKRTTDAERDAKRWTLIALVIGYNELAKKAKTLGEKVFFRLARDSAEADAIRMGVEPILEPSPFVLQIDVPCAMLKINFREQDIELMRATVAERDAKA